MAKKPRRRRESADNDNLISGIYNYCDRWCERCAFTKRCMLFAREQEFAAMKPEGAKSRDPANPKFSYAVVERVATAGKMIEEECRKRGIDLTMTPEAKQAIGNANDSLVRKLDADPLSELSFRYAKSAKEWFKSHKHAFEEKTNQLVAAAELTLPGIDAPAEARDLVDAIQVLDWFHVQIAIKVRRALIGLEREEQHQGDPGDDPVGPELRQDLARAAKSDAHGSAKVALIGIDRSIDAWGRLRTHLPDQADGLIDTLALLDRLRREIEARVPGARAFKRPGFDD